MKALALSPIVILVLASSAVAGGHIGLYGDPNGSVCSIADESPTLMNFYVVATVPTGAVNVAFTASQPPCMASATYVGDMYPFSHHVGGSQMGISVQFLACITEQVHVLTIAYFGTGLTPACCEYAVGPHPDRPDGPVATDCGPDFGTLFYLSAGHITVNPDGTCMCTVPTETSTWGAIKATYE